LRRPRKTKNILIFLKTKVIRTFSIQIIREQFFDRSADGKVIKHPYKERGSKPFYSRLNGLKLNKNIVKEYIPRPLIN